ncbi:MAG: hypothetical protein IKW92_09975 [Firmicutes bacterium]|nr:hypothetical protein [Bacillota bacterium]
MKRTVLIVVMMIAVLTGCYRGDPPEPTPEMDFLIEFFTVNKGDRMNTYLDALSQNEDLQTAIDTYYAELAPFCVEDALTEIQKANYLYLFDKSCTDFADQWKTMELKASYRDSQWQHQTYNIVLHYPGAGKNIEVKGKFDLNEEREIISFSLDLNTLPGDAFSIAIP